MNINGEPTRNDKTLNGETSLGDSTADDLIISGDLTVGGTSSFDGQLDMNNAKIVNLGTPTNSADATTKAYVDSVIPDVTGFLKTDGSNSMSASLDAGTNKVINVVDPAAAQDAATKNYVDTTVPSISGLLKIDGSNAMTASLDAGTNKVINVVDPAAAQDAATKNYVDTTVPSISGLLKIDGSNAMTASLDAGTNKVINVVDPAAAQDAATKNYVDTTVPSISGLLKIDGSNAMTASLNAGTNKVINVVDPAAAQDAATKNYVDTTVPSISGLLKIDGSNAMTASLDAGTNKVVNVVDPTSNQDAATKKYVDDNAGSSLWEEDGADIYRESGNVGIGGGASGRPHNKFEVQGGNLRVGGNMSSTNDFGFMAGVDGDMLSFNTNIIDVAAAESVTLKQQNSRSSNTGFTQLTMRQEYRNASSSNSAVWAINVASESGSFVGNQTNSSILALMKDNGSVVVNSSRNNNGVRLRVHGTSAGSSGFAVISDDRIKYHEQDIKSAITTINKLKAQKYQKITESLDDTGKWIPSDAEWDTVKNEVNAKGQRLYQYIEEIGFIAQDVRKIPELSFCVTGEEEDEAGDQTPLMVNYQDIFCLAIQGIQELDTKRKEDASTILRMGTELQGNTKRILDLNKRLLVLEEKLKNVESNTQKEYIL